MKHTKIENLYKKTRQMILSRVLMAPFIVLILVCGVLVYYFASYSQWEVEHELIRVASNHVRLIDQFLHERLSDLQFASLAFKYEEISDQNHLIRIFHDLQKGSQAFFDLGVFDDKANHVAYVGPFDLVGLNYSEKEWFKEVKEKGVFISDVFLGFRKIPHFIIASRCEEGERTWYLRATIDTLFFNYLVESIRIGRTGEAYLINRTGILQTKRRSGGNLMEADSDFDCYQIGKEKTISFSLNSVLDQRFLYAAAPLESTGWVLLVRQEVGDAYASLSRAVLVSIIMIIFGGSVVVLMAFILASGLANRLSTEVLEKQQMKTQLIMAGKLAEVGEMSTGLAHEINNPLQVMKSEQALMEELISDIEKSNQISDQKNLDLIKDSINQVGIQIERCKRITEGLLNFTRKTERTIQPIKLQEFLPRIVSMVEQRALLENVRIIMKLDSDLPLLMSDPNQLQQVFLNLLNNAIYALRNKDMGEIQITVSKEDSNINFTVSDNGCGISPENMEKIFLPFFTTKPVGQGTGLGLSTVLGIIRGLGGDITVTSEINQGTVFSLFLPMNPPGKINLNEKL
ncbi:GHKL domain-containing protein [bacterium]|nr:GHKL domain-containing protein [bacterium]